MRRGGGMSGAVSLVMILCVLCLAVFATLTYTAADRERQLAELTARRAAEYYAADAEAVRAVAAQRDGAQETLDFSVPVNDVQELHVRTERTDDGGCRILEWATAYNGSWETDESIEIWDGDF